MDNRVKNRKPPDKGRVKMKPLDGLKAMPKELAVGAIQDGTQRLASQLRNAGEREERSDYGGERIEAAAADGARLAARSVEAFLKSGAGALKRNRGEEPPPDDSPLDELSPQEMTPETDAASVAEELPPAEHPTFPEHAENSALPEHPASPENPQTESVFTSEQFPQTERPPLPEHPVPLEGNAQTEIPVAEETVSETSAERASKRRSRHEEESASTERTEEEWRPAYKDVDPNSAPKPVAVIVRRPGGAAEESGRNPGGRGVPLARNPDRAVKTLAGNDAPPLLNGQGVRETAALLPPAGQSAAVEYGRRKLIRERGRELAAKQSDVPLLEANAPTEPLPLPESGVEYQFPQMSESPVTRTGKPNPSLRDALPEPTAANDSGVTLKPKETPLFDGQANADRELVKERESLPSAPHSGSASTGGSGSGMTPNGATSETEYAPNAPQTGRVSVKTREASGYRAASSGSDAAPTAAVQGKQKAVRDRAERISERRTGAISAKQESVSVNSEMSVTPSEQSAVPVKMKSAYAQNETPSADTPSAVQGKEKLIRERTEQVAGRRSDTVSAGQTPADSGKTPPPIPEQDAVPVKTKETYTQKVMSAETPSAAQGKQKLVRERMERVAERRVDAAAGRKSAASANTSAPISNRDAVTVKTKETGVPQEATSPNDAAQGKRKLIRERAEQITEHPIDAASAGEESAAVKVKTSSVKPKQSAVPVRTKEAESVAKPQNAAQGKPKAIREQTERPVDAVSVKREPISEASAPTPERSPVKTKEAYLSTETPSTDTPSAAQVKQTAIREHAERRAEADAIGREPAAVADAPKQNVAPIKTKEAYAPRENPDAMPQTRTAVKERTAQIGERPAPSDSARPEVPEPRRKPVKMKEAAVQIQETPSQNFTVRERADAAFSETSRTERMPVKTKETYLQQGMSRPQSTAPEHEQTFQERGAETAAKWTDAGTVPPRIKEPDGVPMPETTPVKTKEEYVPRQAPRAGDAPPVADKSASVRRQAAVKTRKASIQTSASFVTETPKEPGKTVKTKDGLIQSPATAEDVRSNGVLPSPEPKIENVGASGQESALSKERTDYAANSERRKPVGEQSRAVENRLTLKKEPPSGDTAKKAAGEPKPSVAPMDEGVKTKGAWLRQQGKDRPRERVTTEIFKGKPQTKGQPPVKLAKGLPVPKTADSFPLALPPWEPSAPTGGGTATTRFVREKGGTAAGKVVRDLVPSGEKGLQIARPTAIKEAGTTGAKAVRTAERSAKKLRTAQTVSFRTARSAAQTARSVQMRRAAVAAQQGAKAAAATLRETARKVVSTVKSAIAAAQSLVSALAAGGSTALVIVIVICLVAALIAAPFGLFLSGQTGVGENIQTAVSELTGEYNARIEQIKSETAWDELDIAPDIISAMQNNWKNVLAVYAVRVTTKDADATEVVTMTDEKKEILRETFFDMNRISYYTTSRTVYSGDDDDEDTTIVTLHISVTAKNAQEMADEYYFNARQRELLEEMLSPEYDELFESLLGGADAGGGASPVLDPEILDGITLLMPSDLSEQRRQVVLTGAQLLGRVHYFWGGKSRVLGWDSRWGTPTRVWAAGSPSTGTVRPFGLDCSGFVDWVFYNVSGGTYLIGHGGGASSQHSYCTPISWSEALPGDLAFYPGDRHVGIVVGHDTFGNVKIMHCASGSNNVVITGKIGFVSVGRPYYYL